MPSHAHCTAVGCANRKNSCKHKLIPSKDGRNYVRVCACGVPDPGCGNQSEECRSVRFHRLPKEKLRRERWIRAMKRQNLSQTANTYVCSVHFSTGTGSTMERQPPMADPSIFLHVSKPVKSRRTRTSLGARTTGGEEVSLSPAAPPILLPFLRNPSHSRCCHSPNHLRTLLPKPLTS